MGIGSLRRHYAEAEPEAADELSAMTVAELRDALAEHGVHDEDLEPGSGADGNVVKEDRVAALREIREG